MLNFYLRLLIDLECSCFHKYFNKKLSAIDVLVFVLIIVIIVVIIDFEEAISVNVITIRWKWRFEVR
jgi:hypothetical protein